MYRALSAMHMLHKQRLSGKKRKLLSEEGVIGILFYITENKFGLLDLS